jgi:hypothetical protein
VVPSDPSVLKEAIRQGQVVVLGLALWDEFFGAQGDVLGAPVPTQLIGDLHAVALVGFDADEGSLLIRNSWDEGWGVAGHGRLAEAALPVVCVGSWVVVDEIDPG